ncbi:MAG: translation initiation factor IF-3 [Clostridia bacterium]|nr:translation initiation factor IF-3 [Clostridia bacterium]MCX4366702.1 translation initiation factor IF-3 [Clostridia bacterium]
MKDQQLLNEQIREREIRVIDSEGNQLGIMSSRDALGIAMEKELDLVMISPQAKPPVCKIMDYGKFKYEMIKKAKEAKKNQKVVEMKEIWLSATIDTNDLLTKAKQAEKFLKGGDRVRVSIRLKGRQMARPEIGIKVMEEFIEVLKETATVDKKPSLEGRSIAMILNPPSAKK